MAMQGVIRGIRAIRGIKATLRRADAGGDGASRGGRFSEESRATEGGERRRGRGACGAGKDATTRSQPPQAWKATEAKQPRAREGKAALPKTGEGERR